MEYYCGNFYKDSTHRNGWLVGHFLSGICETSAEEIKFWAFSKGPSGHREKFQRNSVECTFILKGKIQGQINGDAISLEAGDYVFLPPGIRSNFPVEVLEDAEGITVKAPSIKSDTERQ